MLEFCKWIDSIPIWIGRLIAEFWIFHHQPDHVHTEAVHAAVEPEAHHIEYGSDYLWVSIVQIRLLFDELMEVVLLCTFIVRPGRTSKMAQPVIRGTSIRSRIAPQIPIALRVIAAAATFKEPGMLVRCMVGHQIKDHFHAALVCFLQQAVEVFQAAE